MFSEGISVKRKLLGQLIMSSTDFEDTEEVRAANLEWKEVDPSKSWVVFDFEETLAIVLEGEVERRVNSFKEEGLNSWTNEEKTHVVVLRPHALEVLNDLGKDFNIAMLTTMDTDLVQALVKVNPEFSRLFCFVAGKGRGIENPFCKPSEDIRVRQDYAVKHPDRINSKNPKVMVDDSGVFEEMWVGEGLAFVKAERAVIPLKQDEGLKNLPDRVRDAFKKRTPPANTGGDKGGKRWSSDKGFKWSV